MHEALGAATPRLVGHIREGCLWPALFAIAVVGVIEGARAKPDEGVWGGFEQVGNWNIGTFILAALATLLLAQLLDALYPSIHRLLTGRLLETGSAAEKAPVIGPSLAAIEADSALAATELHDARKERRRKHHAAVNGSRQRSTRYGCAVEAFLEGPHNFRFDVLGAELQLIAAERSNGEDRLGQLYTRSTTQLMFSFVCAIASLGAIPLALQGEGQVGFVWFLSFLILSYSSYRASVSTVIELSKVGDKIFFIHRFELLKRLSPYSEAPQTVAAEERIWELRAGVGAERTGQVPLGHR